MSEVDPRIASLAEDLIRIIVQQNGGFTSGREQDVREVVRMCRELYSEIDKPTERPESYRKRTDHEDVAGEEW